MSGLQFLREILSPGGKNPPAFFTSIELVRDGFSFAETAVRPGEHLSFSLGYRGLAPERLIGHLFDDSTGYFIARFPGAQLQAGNEHLLCAFQLPALIEAQQVCLVIEGLWADGTHAGCEKSFSVGQPKGAND